MHGTSADSDYISTTKRVYTDSTNIVYELI